jgi:hypothetical protein
MIRWLIAGLILSLVVAVCYMGYMGGRDERNERAAAGMEAATVKLRAVTAADTIREITVILHELAAAWYSVTDRPLRFGCEARGFPLGSWLAPTEGAEVFKYNVEMELRGSVYCDTSLILPVPAWASVYRARVQGETINGVAGGWGTWGPWYVAGGQS